MTRAAAATLECALSLGGEPPSGPGRPPRRSAAACRAVTSADRLPGRAAGDEDAAGSRRGTRRGRRPTAAPGSRPRSRRRRRSTPPRSWTMRPRRGRTGRRAFVGAAGTNATAAGWSVEIVAGARTSAQMRSASSPPMPVGRDRLRRRAGQSSSAGATPIERLRARDAVRARTRRSRARAPRSRRCIVHRSHACASRATHGPARGPARGLPRPERVSRRAPGRTRRTRRRTSGCRPRCAAPRSSTAPRRRGS